MSHYQSDAIVIGAGIVGAACAAELARRGLRVRVLDAGLPAATAAGMGHLLVLDDNPAELAMSQYSVARWKEWSARMPASCAYVNNGTLWLADSAGEFAVAEKKFGVLRDAGVTCELWGGQRMAVEEPMLKPGLHGGLIISDDSILYAPRAARWLLESAGDAVEFRRAQVMRIDDDSVLDSEGNRYQAPVMVLANGLQGSELCPDIPLIAKKGHLAITDRYSHSIRHTLVELGYVTSAHNATGPSVACNIQPRPTGQLFIGATRQFDSLDPAVEPWMLGRLLRRAQQYVPGLGDFNIIRSWTGFRAATPDGQPFIGRHPKKQNLWLALGHEGLGVTTAPVTAELLAADIFNEKPPIPKEPFDPARLQLEAESAE